MSKVLMTIKIGQTEYEVYLFPDGYVENYGVCMTMKQSIFLSPHQTWRQVGNTLLHEVMHAIYHESGLSSVENATEETTVTIMATWLHMVMHDNPHLNKFITKTDKYWQYAPTGNLVQEAMNNDE
jgi:hypothetical protein